MEQLNKVINPPPVMEETIDYTIRMSESEREYIVRSLRAGRSACSDMNVYETSNKLLAILLA